MNVETPAGRSNFRYVLVAIAAAPVAMGVVLYLILHTGPVRASVRSFTKLVAAANRGDLEAARSLCTPRYLAEHGLEAAPEGGLVGLPRGMHPNFKAWRASDGVLVCPTDRVGPVYRFVEHDGAWKYDGLAGVLERDGHVRAAP